jgi:hypothetical protein
MIAVKWCSLSDRQRWIDPDNYQYDWLTELSDNDKDIIKSLASIGEGEFSGLSAAKLMRTLCDQLPSEYRKDWVGVDLYLSVISYEEFRHGMILSSLNNIEYTKADINDMFNAPNTHNWNPYTLLLSVSLSEATNIIMYDNIIGRINDDRLKYLLSNIKRDESRHYTAWKEIVKDLVDLYKDEFLHAIVTKEAIIHNASIINAYYKGVEDISYVWDSKSVSKMFKMKYDMIQYWFGDDNPYSLSKLKIAHMRNQ